MPPLHPDWKDRNRTIQILQAAEKGKYGVLAAIAYNVEHILGLVRAARQARSPLIIQFFPWAITYSKGLLVRTAADAIDSSLPIALHLDHAQDADLIRAAADALPFDSIMVDMSHHDKPENLARTRELVAYCNARGVATEAEPGRIEGGEDGVADTGGAGLEGSETTVGEVEDFVATGVDVLAPAVGNVHGEYGPAGPRLDFERFIRLEQLVSHVDGRVRVALHGTNGFEPELVRRCVAAGVSKINVNRLVLDDYFDHLAAHAGRIPHTVLMEEGTEKVVARTVEWMEICGSAGKA